MWVVVVAVVALAAVGCSASGPKVLGEDDDGTEVSVKVGEQLVVELPSNPTTGFSWTVADGGPLTQVGEAEYATEAAPDVVGAGGTETFTFDAKKAGSGTLTLEYRRPWETGVEAEDVWSATITVE
jgi:inhibitor of cysteine peptidase